MKNIITRLFKKKEQPPTPRQFTPEKRPPGIDIFGLRIERSQKKRR
ncbi:MAG: hypothetical protein WC556_05200 [Candidatus Methanoperedens sp.]